MAGNTPLPGVIGTAQEMINRVLRRNARP